MSQDAVWLDVLPSMKKFGPALAKEAGDAADKAGSSAGKKFGAAMAKGTAGVATGLVATGGALYKLGSTFDDVTDTIRVGTGATGKDLDALVATAKVVGTKVPSSFEDIGTAVADVNTRLGLTGPTLEKVSSQFLQLGNITGEKIDIGKTTAAMSAFGIKGEGVSKALDQMYQVSQASGVSITELAQRLGTNGAVVKQLGLDFNQAAVLVGTLDKAGVNSNAVMASMARSMTTLAKKGEDPQQAFKRVTGELETLVKQGKDAEAVNLAGKVFGTRGAPQMIAALKSGAVSFKDLDQMAGQTQDTILGAGDDTADFAEQWQLFKNKLAVEVAPTAEKVFNLVGNGMTWVNQVGVPAMKAFVAEWQAGTGKAGEYRAQLDRVVAVVRNVVGWVVQHREALKTLTVGVVGGYVAFRVMNTVMAGYQVVAAGVRGAILATAAAKRVLTAAANSNAVAFIKNTAILVAQKTASLAVSVASKALAAGQWLVNAALSANPIGLVILALAALGAGLVVAYKKSETFRRIVNAAWAGIKTAASVTWAFLRDKVLVPLGTFFAVTLPRQLDSFKAKFGTVWDSTKAAAAKPINFVIGTVYNNGLRKALNLLPGVNLGEASLVKFRTGGYTGNMGVNDAAGIVHGKEYVLTAEETAAMGGPRGVEAWKAVAARGYKGGGYVWPTNSKVLSGNYAGHSGVDVAVPTGSPLFAVQSGSIAYTGYGRGYGNAIFMNDTNGVPWVYGHGSRVLVSPGQAVSKGQLIGYSGYTGNVRPPGPAGAHLHIEAARGGFAAAANRAYTLGLLSGSGVPAGGGKAGSPAAGVLSLVTEFPKHISGVKNKLTELANTPWGKLIRGSISGIIDRVKEWGLSKIPGAGRVLAGAKKLGNGAKKLGNMVLGRGGAGTISGYANGTGWAQPGLAMVGELGLPELVVGPQTRMMQGGEKVYSSAQTRRLLGGRDGLVPVEGRFTIDEDGVAWFRGLAEEVMDDRDDAGRRLSSAGVRQ